VNTTQVERSPRRLPLADIVLTLGLLGVFVAALVTASAWPFATGLFPRMVTVLGVVLAVLNLGTLLLRRTIPDTHPHGEDSDIEAVDVEYVFEHAGLGLWARNLGWLGGFFLLMFLTGIFVAAPAFTVLYLRFSARVSWLFSVGYAVAVGILLYLSFVRFLGLPTPEGILM
jgi:hypothetical protein